MEKTLSDEEIKILRLAMLHSKSILAKIFGSLLLLIVFLNLNYQEDIFIKYEWLKLSLQMLPILIIISGILSCTSFIIDIKNRKKIILKTLCKRLTFSSDVVSHHLIIEGYGEIDLIDYNYKEFYDSFSDELELFEIHIAPKSRVILFVNKIGSFY